MKKKRESSLTIPGYINPNTGYSNANRSMPCFSRKS